MRLKLIKGNFGAIDFAVFIGCLVASALIGVFFALKDRKKNSTQSYLYADGKMNPLFVTISMSVTWASAITVLAFPGEIYRYGIVVLWLFCGMLLGNIVAGAYFVPLIHKLQLATMFEYLELRFNRKLRVMSSIASNVQQLTYMGVATYLPALALTVVAPIPLEWSIVVTGTICTFYTAAGGIKAVIWTDVLQSVIMLVGMGLVFIKACSVAGGFKQISESALRGGRINFFKFTWDVREQHSVLADTFGFIFLGFYGSAVGQPMIQRYLCCKTPGSARKSLYFHLLPIGVFVTLSNLNGLAMYSILEDCNLVKGGIVSKTDQMLPLLVVNLFRSIPGIAGIFVAAVYSGTLSTVSSGVNSMASVILNDVILLIRPKMSLRGRLLVSKIASISVGALVMLFAYASANASSTMVQLVFLLHGALCGPILGIVVLGVFTRFVNSKAAVIAFTTGTAFGVWLIVGRIFVGGDPSFAASLPSETYGCDNTTTVDQSLQNVTSQIIQVKRSNLSRSLYSLSSFYIGFFVTVATIVIGLVVSIFTRNDIEEADPLLFVPLRGKAKQSRMKIYETGLEEKNTTETQLLSKETTI